jgi:hypothetical protein
MTDLSNLSDEELMNLRNKMKGSSGSQPQEKISTLFGKLNKPNLHEFFSPENVFNL